ncbi:hypothetical protein H7J83_09350 [Mycobacterium mantenii]|uniref:hypothetical protein n=1 Tax=Mycobacterium mantenii TaxID=560555 RepID=UPI001150F85D|nr:hypothetical protein [Mycobacterium mantenii]MCV7242948.1 hypothetical protein [Mycobacterium mantenii]
MAVDRIEPKKKKKKWPWLVGGVFLFFVIVGACNHSGGNNSSTASSTPSAAAKNTPTATTPSAAAKNTPTATTSPPDPNNPPVPNPQGNTPSIDAHWSKDPDGTERVTFNEGSGEGDAKTDTVAVLKVAQASFPDATSVVVTITGDMCDPYGNCHNAAAATLVYSHDTMAKFNFSGDYFNRFSTEGEKHKNQIWALADNCVTFANNWSCERP